MRCLPSSFKYVGLGHMVVDGLPIRLTNNALEQTRS